MILKYCFIILSISIVYLLADSAVCPNPEKAKNLAHQEEIHVRTPSYGRREKTIVIPRGTLNKPVTCLTLTGNASAGPSGSVSIASVGLTEGDVTIKLVSQIKRGIDVTISAYTE